MKILNILKKKNILVNILIILSFIILSLFSVAFIWYRNKIYFTGDSAFHIQRLGELLKTNQLFPHYALNSFNAVGSAVMAMYPYLFLYPIALIYDIVGSITSTLYITFIIGTFLALLISYLSSLSYSKDKLSSYIFSLFYSLSYETIVLYFVSNMFGEYLSIIFLPLVIFGSINLLRENKWVMLSIGMSLIIYSSIITSIFLAGLLILWLVMNYKLWSKKKFIFITKAISLSIITTAMTWIPLLNISRFNNLHLPSSQHVGSISIFNLIYYSIFQTDRIPTITIYALIGLIIGAIGYKMLSRLDKKLYLFSIIILVICSNIFPWKLFSGSFILFKLVRKIQFAWRMLILPQMILCFILALLISNFCSMHMNHIKKWCALCGVLILVVFIQPIGQISSLNVFEGHKVINNTNLMKDYSVREDYMDYLPKSSTNEMSQLRHHYIIHNGKRIKFHFFGNGKIGFKLDKHLNNLNIPFVFYNGSDYKVYIDSHHVKATPNSKQLMTFTNLHEGYHIVKINTPLNKIVIISYILTLSSFIVYIYLILNKFKNKFIE